MFDGLFAWNLRELNVRWRDEPEPVRVLLVTGDFYDTLGVTPIAGRTIAPPTMWPAPRNRSRC